MKIVQAISHYVPAYRFGGPLQVAHSLGRELVRRGHEVSVCCTNQADEKAWLDVPVDEPVSVDGVTVYYETVPRLRRWGYSPAMGRRLQSLIAGADAVLVHAHFQYASWMGARIARRANKPYVVFAHGSLKQDSLRASSRLAKHLYLFLLERRNLQSARHVAFNAEEEMADSLYARNGIVLPNGIAPADFEVLPHRGGYRQRHPEWANRLVYLFLGRIDIRQKAVDILVEAFARLAAEDPDPILVLAGPSEGGDVTIIRNRVAELGLSDRVLFPGLVSGSDKLEMLCDADAFVMPSRYEGLSIALLEAMASGLPVLLSNRAGLHGLVAREGCGVVVNPEAGSVLEGLRQLRNPETRQRSGATARRLVLAQHTWPVIAARLDSLFSQR